MWIVWFTHLQAAFAFQLFLGNGFSPGENAGAPMAPWLWLVCLVPLVVASGIRWFYLPQLKLPGAQLVAMIVGLSFTEASVLLGIFLVAPDFPQHEIGLFVAAVASLIQFAPSYATPRCESGS